MTSYDVYIYNKAIKVNQLFNTFNDIQGNNSITNKDFINIERVKDECLLYGQNYNTILKSLTPKWNKNKSIKYYSKTELRNLLEKKVKKLKGYENLNKKHVFPIEIKKKLHVKEKEKLIVKKEELIKIDKNFELYKTILKICYPYKDTQNSLIIDFGYNLSSKVIDLLRNKNFIIRSYYGEESYIAINQEGKSFLKPPDWEEIDNPCTAYKIIWK
jgi:hypothetical protein